MKIKSASLVLSLLAMLIPASSGCSGLGDICWGDCRVCPCSAGYICKEVQLIENGGATTYRCGLPTKALTATPPMTLPPDPAPVQGGNVDAAGCGDL